MFRNQFIIYRLLIEEDVLQVKIAFKIDKMDILSNNSTGTKFDTFKHHLCTYKRFVLKLHWLTVFLFVVIYQFLETFNFVNAPQRGHLLIC